MIPSTSTPERSSAAVDVAGLRVAFGEHEAVRGVSLVIGEGECLALVGESGSGKSVSARALLGLSGDGARVTAERIRVGGTELPRSANDAAWPSIRGGEVGLVHQDALVALDPLRPVWREVDDAVRLHTRLPRAARRARVLELLRRVGLDEPERVARRRSGQLSGGQRQRVLIAAALAGAPRLLIADEPTSSVDATVQAQLIELFREVKAAGTTILFITHDLSVARQLADRVAVMSDGLVVESAPTEQLFTNPAHEVTRTLIEAQPSASPRVATPVEGDDAPLLDVRHVSKSFPGRGTDRVLAVRDASLTLSPGETLGLVGASGSGKSTLVRLAMGLEHPDDGSVTFHGTKWNPAYERSRRPLRAALGYVPQDALSSFDPRRTTGQILADALTAGRSRSISANRRAIDAALEQVGLPASVAGARPLHLSGGQRQRVAIARALAPGPRVLVCDEPVSSLDVTVQAQVLALLERLVGELELACLFVSHDLAVVAQIADRVAVMDAGELVETGSAAQIFDAPKHPASRALLDARRGVEER